MGSARRHSTRRKLSTSRARQPAPKSPAKPSKRRKRGAVKRGSRREKIARELLSVPTRIDEHRSQVVKALAVVDCCRFASDSMINNEHKGPDIIGALDVACTLLADAWEQMEITADLSRPSMRQFALRYLKRSKEAARR